MITCPRCKTIEPDGTKICTKCGCPLSLKEGAAFGKPDSPPLRPYKYNPFKKTIIVTLVVWVFILIFFSIFSVLTWASILIISVILTCFSIALWNVPKIISYAIERLRNKD